MGSHWAGSAIVCLLLTGTGLGCGGGASSNANPAPVPQAPVATFTVAPSAGRAPLTVTFQDASTGDITQRTWTFGDGTTSTETHPIHTYTSPGSFPVSLTVAGPGGTVTKTQAGAVVVDTEAGSTAWRFAVVGDTHVPTAALIAEMVTSMKADGVNLVLVPGDIVEGGAGANTAELRTQLAAWKAHMAPLYAAGIGVYPIRGNHEADVKGDTLAVWNEAFSGAYALPSNGPSGETNLTYSFTHKNALFLGLDEYVSIHRVNQPWVDQQLAARGNRPHVFAFGHEPAFKAFHTDCLDDYPAERDAFWNSLKGAGAKLYLSGHDHFFDAARIDDGDGNASDDLMQVVVGGGGGTLFDRYAYVGANSTFTPTNLAHDMANGYLLVEVSGDSDSDLGVTLSFKRRMVDPVTAAPSYVASYTTFYSAASPPIASTGPGPSGAIRNPATPPPIPTAGAPKETWSTSNISADWSGMGGRNGGEPPDPLLIHRDGH